jgi:Protein of unknown function (DUF1549)/Protein of unknown function (DUF1553)
MAPRVWQSRCVCDASLIAWTRKRWRAERTCRRGPYAAAAMSMTMFCTSVLTALAALCFSAAAAEGTGRADVDARNPIAVLFKGERLRGWAWQPVAAVELPPVLDAEWSTPVDRLVRAQMQRSGEMPRARAHRRVLARRLYLTLTGLPPSPEEMQLFMDDTAPDAVERLVDRLLADPAYGEHMAAWWLDVARYADSTGYDWDEWRRESWRYRDYVIRSFRADKAFDVFVREQLAGDEMLSGPPRDAAEQDRLLATGFLRVGPWDNSSKLFGEEEKTRTQWMSDLVETTGSAFLGLTMSCCRCHDHKTDPLSQADYYRMRAVFETLEFRDAQPLDLAAEQERIAAVNAALEQERGPLEARLDVLAKQKAPEAEQKALKEQIAALRARELKYTTGLLAGNAADGAQRTTHVLAGGNHAEKREAVGPGVLSYFQPQDFSVPERRRTQLAEWVVSAENPLTPRVLADRLWAIAFGQHLVAAPDDFGLAGPPPAHPALVDWLAGEVRRQGWSWKRMLRMLVLSRAWQQERAPQRMRAEVLRDSLLRASGLLLTRDGGPSVWPDVAEDVLNSNPAILDDNAEKTKGWYPSERAAQPVRSIYLMKKRSLKVPFMEVFDQPDNFQSCAQRRTATVAPQALTLLNSPEAVRLAEGLAQRVAREAGGDAQAQMTRAFFLTLSRPPAPEEAALLQPLWQQAGAAAGCRVVLNLNESVYVE